MLRGACKIKQQDEYDCGAACLSSIASWYGVKVSLSGVRRACGCSKGGVTVKGIIDGAKTLGLRAKGYKSPEKNIDYFRETASPFIVHLERNGMYHFVAVYRTEKEKIIVMDPSSGDYEKINIEDFKREWTGYLILLVPGDDLEKRDERVNRYVRMFRLLKFHKKELLYAIAGSIALAIIGVCNSLFLQQLIDRAIPNSDWQLLAIVSLIVIVLIPLSLYIGYGRTIYLLRNGIKIDTSLVLTYLRHIFLLPSDFFSEYSSGDITSRLSDASTIRTFISEGLVSLIVSVLTLLCVIVLMFTYYWKLALFTLLFIPFYVILYFVSDRINRKYSKELAVAGAKFESDVIDSIEGAESVRHFNAVNLSEGRCESSYTRLAEKSYRAGRAGSMFNAAGDGISRMLLATIIVIGGYAVFRRSMTMGEMVSFYTLCAFFTAPLASLVSMNSLVNQALVSSERLFDIIGLKPAGDDEKECSYPQLLSRPNDIEFCGIDFRYAGRENLFSDFSCIFRKGEITAVSGESGCGKTTMGALIMRDLSPSEGKIFVGGTDIATLKQEEWRKYVSISSQRCHVFNASILDNITAGEDNPDIDRVMMICASLGMADMIRLMPYGLMTEVGERGRTLSGGEMQKVSIARMLYINPMVCIFDESTSFMDEVSEKYVLGIMEYLRNEGKSVIVISHRNSNISIADSIINMS